MECKDNRNDRIFCSNYVSGHPGIPDSHACSCGNPVWHFGHIFVVLGIIVLGGKKGAISGTLGLLVFDLLNGYVAAMPKIFVETVIKCLVVGALLSLAEKRAGDDKRKRYAYTLVCTVVYVFGTLFFEWLFGAAELIIAGSGVGAAAAVQRPPPLCRQQPSTARLR